MKKVTKNSQVNPLQRLRENLTGVSFHSTKRLVYVALLMAATTSCTLSR